MRFYVLRSLDCSRNCSGFCFLEVKNIKIESYLCEFISIIKHLLSTFCNTTLENYIINKYYKQHIIKSII